MWCLSAPGGRTDLHADVRAPRRLVDDLQELAKRKPGRWRWTCERLAVDAARAGVRRRGSKPTRAYRIDAAAAWPCGADPDRLRQTVVNLLTNAARQTAPMCICLLPLRRTGNWVRVEVQRWQRAAAKSDTARASSIVCYHATRAGAARRRSASVRDCQATRRGVGLGCLASSDASSVTVGFALPRAVAALRPDSDRERSMSVHEDQAHREPVRPGNGDRFNCLRSNVRLREDGDVDVVLTRRG